MENNNNNSDDLLWVRLKTMDGGKDSFLSCVETLERIGVKTKRNDKDVLIQSCHILHKRNKYAIVHFKEMFIQDGKEANFTVEDKARRNTIAALLESWGLIEIEDKEKAKSPRAPFNLIGIIKAQDRDKWILEPKYTMISKRKRKD